MRFSRRAIPVNGYVTQPVDTLQTSLRATYHGQHVRGGRVDARSEVVVVHDDLLLRAVVNGVQHLHGHFVAEQLRTYSSTANMIHCAKDKHAFRGKRGNCRERFHARAQKPALALSAQRLISFELKARTGATEISALY